MANRAILPKFPDLTRFRIFLTTGFYKTPKKRLRDSFRNVPILKSKQTEFVRQIAAGQKVHRPSPTVITLRNLSNLSIFAFQQNAEKPGPSGQKFSKPPLEELDEALEVLS